MQYVGRLSFKHLKEEEDIEVEASAMSLAFCVEAAVDAPCFIFEVGDCGEPHAHFYFETGKSAATVRRLLQKHFRLPAKVRLAFMKPRRLHIAFGFISFIRFMSLFAGLLFEDCRPCQA